MNKKGWFWHVHHDTLIEWSDDIDERIEYIKIGKPANEIPLRLKLLKLVKGEIPDAAWQKAGAALEKADAAWQKAGAALEKADAAWQKAGAARQKAGAALETNKKVLALHQKECPDCPWDGKTIFSKG
jgi:hypothetical protein